MLRLLLFRFWPVLLPALVYWLWHKNVVRKAKLGGTPEPRFRDGPWYWLVIASLGMGILCFLAWNAGEVKTKGRYVPPHLENGAMVPGHVEPEP